MAALAVVETRKLDERKLKAFNAIVNFVTDLNEVYGNTKSVTALSLYNRLVVKHIKFTEIDRIDSALGGFIAFFDKHGAAIMKGDWESIPRDTIISYGTSDKICLEIQKYLYQADEDTRKVIRQHLLTIQAILRPADNSVLLQELSNYANSMQNIKPLELNAPKDLKAALNIDENTKEGKFISGIMHKVKESMEDMGDTSNPTAAIMNLATSGIIPDLIGGLQSGVASGEMDMTRLMQTMIGAMHHLLPQQAPQSQSVSPTPQIAPQLMSATSTPRGESKGVVEVIKDGTATVKPSTATAP